MLQVIAWELSMAVALPTSLLVDMPERQQVDVALQVSDACVDLELKNSYHGLPHWRTGGVMRLAQRCKLLLSQW